jgi:glycosyltransferase involved in cell wall biosynthesis/GT2 family glycosyltransferase
VPPAWGFGRAPIALSKSRFRNHEPSAERRFWFFIGDSIDWLANHDHLTGVGRVSTELYFAATARVGGRTVSPCVLDRSGDRLTAANVEDVSERLTDQEAGAGPKANRKASLSPSKGAGPQPGDHVFFTGLVWTPTFTELFARLAHKGIGFSVLLHDIIPLETSETVVSKKVRSFSEWLICVLQAADVVYVSNALVEDQVRRWACLAGVEIGAELVQIPFGLSDAPAVDSALLTKIISDVGDLRRHRFVLSVGTIDKRKNQVYLCRMWQRLAKLLPGDALPQLVLAGRDDLGLTDRRSVFADLVADHRLLVLENLSDREITALYEACLFMAFPSTREGYGLPVAESLRHGKLCLASALPVVRAHAGDLVWYFDLDDEAGADALFMRAITDADARGAAEQAIATGFRPHAWASTFDRMVESALEVGAKPLEVIDFGARRPEFPGASDYDIAEVLERAERWCTDRNPEVSILIINWNAADLTLEGIRQIWANTEGHTYEILVIDNGSDDRDVQRLRNLGSGVRFLPLGCNRFFGEANNIGAEAARGEYVCLLNNDAFVQNGWLVHLIDALKRHPEVGAVGPMFLYPNGVVQEAGAEIDAGGYPIRFGRDGAQDEASILIEKYSDYISAATLLMPRDLFIAVGGFDLAYEPAYYEDTDLCFKVQAFGKKVLYCPEARVIHIEGSSANGDLKAETRRQALGDLNRAKFIGRWGAYLQNRNEAALTAARSTFEPPLWRTIPPPASPEKIAVVYTPYALTPGGGERYLLSWAQALMRGYRVSVVTSHPYSNIRLRNLAAELRLDLAALNMLSETEFLTTREPDLMVVMGNHVLPPTAPRGRVNFYHCQFPFSLGTNPLGGNGLEGYDAVVVNSEYTRAHFLASLERAKLPAADVRIVYPPVEPVIQGATQKRSIILSVGRFFVGGHSKRHDLLIDAFKALQEQSDGTLELHLAGSSTPESQHMDYLAQLHVRAEGLPVTFHVNASHEALQDLYRRAAIYWHGAGLGQDLKAHPEQAEHFGISLVEAMSAGVVPFAFDAGGPREIILLGKNGFLYRSLDQLVKETNELLGTASPDERERLSVAARQRSEDFSVEVFRHAIWALVDEFA